MKTYTILSLLAANAFSQSTAGSFYPYGAGYFWDQGGWTEIAIPTEKITTLKVFKGTNGCISGFTLNSASGTYTIDYATWSPVSQTPPPSSCTSNTLCITQTLSATQKVVEVTMTSNKHLAFSYGCVDSISFKTNDQVSFGCYARVGTAYAAINSPGPGSPYVMQMITSLAAIQADTTSNCMLAAVSAYYYDPDSCITKPLAQINLSLTPVNGLTKNLFTGAASTTTITSNSGSCSNVEYALSISPSPVTPGLITLIPWNQQITFAASSTPGDAQVYTLQLQAKFTGDLSWTKLSSTATYTYVNPCNSATVSGNQHPTFTTTVLASASSPTSLWFDSVSGSAATQLCGPFSVSVTKTTTPITYVEATMSSDFTWTTTPTQSILTASPTLAAEIGNYIFQFVICLANYASATCKTFSSSFTINPCLVTSFTMINLTPTYDQSYTVASPSLTWSVAITGLSTQTPACGYSEAFTISVSPAFSSAASFAWTQTSTLDLTVLTSNSADIGSKTVTITSTLQNYNVVPAAAAPSASKSFSLTIMQSCLTATIVANAHPSFTTSVLVPASTSTALWYDSISGSAATQVCGPFTVTLTKTTTPPTYNDGTMSSDFVLSTTATQSILTVSAQLAAEVGSYIFHFVICLTNYAVVCTNFDTSFVITPCEVTAFNMIDLSPANDKTYNIADPTLSWSLAISGLTTQVPACGYAQAFTHTVSTAFQTASSLQFTVSATTVDFALNTNNLADVNLKTVTLTSTLQNYVVASGTPAPTIQKSFTIQIVDPCNSATITATAHPAITASVLSSASSAAPLWFDSHSGSAAQQLCGPFTVTLTKPTSPATYNDATMGSDFTWSTTSTQTILSLTPTVVAEIGSYVFNFVVCLQNYVSVVCASFNSLFQITPCVVTAFTMIPLSPANDKTYTVSNAALTWSLAIPGLTTQTPACGYVSSFTFTTNIPFSSATPLTLTTTSTLDFSIYTTNLADANVRTITLTATLQSYNVVPVAPAPTVSSTFQLSVLNPCDTATVVALAHPLLTTSVLVPQSQPTPIWYDSYSGSSAFQLCGPFTVTVTKTTYPATYVDALMNTDFTWTTNPTQSILTASPTLAAEVGDYIFQFLVCLLNYSMATCANFASSVKITPCVVTSFTMQNLSPMYDKTYIVNDPTLSWPPLAVSSLTLQTPACGYQQSYQVTFSAAFSSSAPFTTLVTATDINFSFYSSNLADSTVYTIWLSSTLLNYNVVPAATTPTTSQSFQLTVVNPCLTTTIATTPTPIQDFVTFAGYKATSQLKYKFSDTISIANTLPTDLQDFCGEKVIVVQLNATNTQWITVQKHQDFIVFSPPSETTQFGLAMAKIIVSMKFDPQIKNEYTFQTTTLGSIVPIVTDQTYTLGESTLFVQIQPFKVLPADYNVGSSSIQVYIVDQENTNQQIDLNCGCLQKVDTLKWIQFNKTDDTISIQTNDSSLVGNHKVLIVQKLTNFQSVHPQSQFKLAILPVLRPYLRLAPYFAPQLANQVYNQCNRSTDETWSFKFPIMIDPNNASTKMTVRYNRSFFVFDNATGNITQKKLSQEFINQTISVTLANDLRLSKTYSMHIRFICVMNPKPYSPSASYIPNTKQRTWPSAFVKLIESNGVLHLKFDRKMKVPDHPEQIQNDTIKLNDTDYPIIQFSVIKGKLSEPTLLQFNWTLLNYTSAYMEFKLDFQNKTYVSLHCLNYDYMLVTIYGFQYFADNFGNLMQAPTILKLKQLPQMDSDSALEETRLIASKLTAAIIAAVLIHTVISYFTLSPLQAVLEQVKQLQIIIHIFLIGVAYPATATLFLNQLMQILTFQFYDFSDFYNKVFNLDPDSNGNNPLNDLFGRMGYGAIYLIQNFGSLCLTIFVTPAIWLGLVIINKVLKDRCNNAKIKWTRLMFYDFWISFFSESYLFLAVCSGLNLCYNFSVDTFGDVVNTVVSVVFMFLLLTYTLFVPIFYNLSKVFERVKQNDQEFMQKYGGFLSEFNFLRRERLIFVYDTFNTLRKLWLACIVVYQTKNPVFSIFQVNFQSIIMLIVLGYTEPMKDKIFNYMHLINESFVFIFTYHLYVFTDFMPYIENRLLMGKVLMYLTIINITLNLIVIEWYNTQVVVLKLKFLYLSLKYKFRLKKNKKIREKMKVEQQQRVMQLYLSQQRFFAAQANSPMGQQNQDLGNHFGESSEQSENQVNLSGEIQIQDQSQSLRLKEAIKQNPNQQFIQTDSESNIDESVLSSIHEEEKENDVFQSSESDHDNTNLKLSQATIQSAGYQASNSQLVTAKVKQFSNYQQKKQSIVNPKLMTSQQIQDLPDKKEVIQNMEIKYGERIKVNVLGSQFSKFKADRVELLEVNLDGSIIRYLILINGYQEHTYLVYSWLTESEQLAQRKRAKEHFYKLLNDTQYQLQARVSVGNFRVQIDHQTQAQRNNIASQLNQTNSPVRTQNARHQTQNKNNKLFVRMFDDQFTKSNHE